MLSSRASKIIAKFGTEKLSAMGEHEAFSIDNCGLRTLREIALFLKEVGSPFRDHERIMERLSPKKRPKKREVPTIRDIFASAAIIGIIARYPNPPSLENISRLAYDYADKMIEARKK